MKPPMPRQLWLWTWLLLVVCEGSAAPQERPNGTFALTLLHTNDLHGHLLPFAYTETGRSKTERPSVGGAARRATLVRQLKRQIKNPVLLIDSGDTFTRGPLTNAYEGIADVEAMNAVGYDLAAIGNNEFKAKDAAEVDDAAGAQSALLQVVKRARFPWLCANAFDGKGAFLEGVQPYIVREIEGVRVGFLGLTAPRSAGYPQTRGWTITDPIAAAQTWIPKARAHCDLLIAVTHIGDDLDRELAAKTTGLDAIVGGDSHTFLYKALEVPNPNGIKVPIVQDGEFGVNLGRFDLRFARNPEGRWALAGYDYALLPIGLPLPEAPDVAAKIAPYVRPLQVVTGKLEKVGATVEDRSRLTTQAIVEALRAESGADLAMNPEGSGLFEVFRTREVTRYAVQAVMPFKNRLATAELTGAEIEALRRAQPKTVVAGDASHLDPAKTYRVAFVDYIAQEVYKIAPERLQPTGRDIREVFIAHIGKRRSR